jgi:tRNA/rRNA methyltransferase
MATENRLEPPLETPPNATFEALEGYYQHLESFLLKIGYLYPHTAAARMEKFRQFYHLARPTVEELALLRVLSVILKVSGNFFSVLIVSRARKKILLAIR